MSNTKSSNSGCFSGVLRRILCSGSPQTHPSDHIMELKTVEDDHVANKVQIQASSEIGPGIVARLMGLDSMPENDWLQKGKIPGPVMRSRSVNFVDYMLQFDLTQAKHRRVKTSASFREVPQGPQQLQQHNKKSQEYLFVHLDNLDQNIEAAGFKTRISEKGDGPSSKHAKQIKEKVAACKKQQSQEKNKKISKLKNEPIRRVSSGNRSLKAGSCINTRTKNVQLKGGVSSKKKSPLKEEVSGLTRKKKSNPVSFNNYAARRENGISEDYSRKMEVKSEKKLGSTKSVICEDASAHRISISERFGKQESTKKNLGSTNIEEAESNNLELVLKPSKLAEEDVKFSNFITNKFFRFQDFEEICAEFGEQILDLMLGQVADELEGFQHHMQMTVPCHA